MGVSDGYESEIIITNASLGIVTPWSVDTSSDALWAMIGVSVVNDPVWSFQMFLIDPILDNVQIATIAGEVIEGRAPQVSNSGRYIAYYDYTDQVVKVIANGDPFTEILVLPYNADPAWSPDDSRLALLVNDSDAEMSLQIFDLDEREVIATYLIENDLVGFEGIDWSPTGKEIVFSLTHATRGDWIQQDVHIFDLDELITTRFTHTDKILETIPRWSPNGKCIAYISTRENESVGRIVIATINGEESISLRFKSGAWQVSWTNDPYQLVVISGERDVHRLQLQSDVLPDICIE